MSPTTDPPTPISMIILAGGRSRRMGTDKAWLELDGAPLIAHVIRRLVPLAAEFVISTNDPDIEPRLRPHTDRPIILAPDRFADAGPLAGLHAGLSAMSQPWGFAVAADMPFVNPALVRRMLAEAGSSDAVIPRFVPPGSDVRETEPLHALYHARCSAAIAGRLAAGDRRLISFLPDVNVRYIEEALIQDLDPAFLSFFNINTPEQWEQARRLIGGS